MESENKDSKQDDLSNLILNEKRHATEEDNLVSLNENDVAHELQVLEQSMV